MKLNDKKMIILFDGVCNICIFSIQFIINKDSKDIFRIASIQSLIGKEIIEKYSIDIKKNNSIILINNDNISYRSTAVLSILNRLNTFWKILVVFYIIPYPIRDYIYRVVAKNRYSIFGKKNKCMIPDKYVKSKFL